ncbi:hypothetical protein RCH09_002861 [Actimicrobium sp. GrIS 1.19]|uniref:hypothetical protein n=1 Tax=Actimicrobium sp. GrIS 1.19 TaxID=3071708 RepID=UPI002E06D142|nr:hypothetical protein [Actimicrobium sp. GrIS 1.19]
MSPGFGVNAVAAGWTARQRRGVMPLVVIIGLHLLLIGLLIEASRRQPVREAVGQVMTMLLPEAAPPLPERAAAAQRRTPVTMVRAVTQDHPASVTAEPRNQATPAEPESATTTLPPPLPASDLATSALRSVGKIDRDLRNEFRHLPERAPDSVTSRLAQGIAAAGVVHRLMPSMQERVLADGRRVTKVTSSSGTYCVTQEGAGANDGLDRVQNGNHMKATNCGNLFD